MPVLQVKIFQEGFESCDRSYFIILNLQVSVNHKLMPGRTEVGGGLGQALCALPVAPVYLFPGHT